MTTWTDRSLGGGGTIQNPNWIVDLTDNPSPTSDDLIITVNDPSGTPVNEKATIGNLFLNAPNTNFLTKITIPVTINSDTAIYKGVNRFIHTFSHPTGGGAIPDGYNLFIGINSGNLTTGSSATLTGEASRNIGIGDYALLSITKGYDNISIGYETLYYNTIGYHNIAIGTDSLCQNISGYKNVAVGWYAINANTLGYYNTALGTQALQANTIGHHNTAVGMYCSVSNTEGTYNTGIGMDAMGHMTTGNYNTALGMDALYGNHTGNNNIAVGYYAGMYETGSSKLFIDGFDRTDEATGRTNSIIYGVMNANPALQTLALNTAVTVMGAFGCNGATAQAGYANATWDEPGAGAFGVDSAAHMAALVELVQDMQAALVANGILATPS